MHMHLDIDEATALSSLSTGHLPTAELVRTLVVEAYERFKSVGEGKVADYIPALAKVPRDFFGVCVSVSTGLFMPLATPIMSSRFKAYPSRSCSPCSVRNLATRGLTRNSG